MKPIIAIVGRPNVGKSTLFNRIVGYRTSIVENEPGVTRDRIYGEGEWLERKFILIDTGGIEPNSEDVLLKDIRWQAELAIEEADVILFLVDGREGLTATDREIAQMLRKSQKPVILVVNKIENYTDVEMKIFEFYELGLGDPFPISAEHGMQVGDLLDKVLTYLPEKEEEEENDERLKIAIIGRPNVGKSSLTNYLLGQKRVIVSDIPGTTRDAIDTVLKRGDQEYILIDTAGIRRKKKIRENVEYYSVIRSLRAVDRSDVVLMVFDAVEGVTEQDKKIVGYAHEAGKGLILVFNKWDLVEKDDKTMQIYTKRVYEELKFLSYAPIIFTSALTGKRVMEILDIVDFVAEEHAKRVTTGLLNEVVEEAVAMMAPPSDKGKRLKIYYATQVSVKPPTFVFFVNEPELMHFSYLRYLENNLREAFGFNGTPIRLLVRKRD
ncbi:ribosome biogenesis GTPase Der [Anoxybacter fermentans]|uniref:GTPase Der n=1 Tax=Anoxybacter fermentans TaxID=1323375 RepID=A0A3S9SWZ7_9FIRM|nr:ribosome biogenesis GTPase Der [Anoxybacter fermentans]AZR72762.1 ribosome biogenesis GTPase Der [Anoxybacter fermentans]